jgi:mRNA interferase MazF
MTTKPYVPDAGHLIWTVFDPVQGREQAGRRPALVVSPAIYSQNTGFAIVCPITSRIRNYPTSVILPSGLPVSGEILVDHIRSLDIRARPLRYAGVIVPSDVAGLVRARLDALITI